MTSPDRVAAASGTAADETDAALLERVRAGDKRAYGALWDRHHRAALGAARAITSAFDADDLVSEAFVRVLKAIERGNGPSAAFRPYLITTIRSVAARWGAQPAELTPDELEVVDPDSSDEAFAARFDQSLTVRAFNTLPERWQEVLWYTEAEQLPPREVAALIGIKPNAVSALAKRAREGLRQAWVQAHIETAPAGSECRWSIDRLAASTRKALPARERERLDAHLDECDRCPLAAAEMTEASRRLGALILIGFLGAGAATAYGAFLKPAAATAATAGAGAGAGAFWPPKPTHVRNVAIGAGAAVAAGAIAVGVAFAATGAAAPAAERDLITSVAQSSAAAQNATTDASPAAPAPSTPGDPASPGAASPGASSAPGAVPPSAGASAPGSSGSSVVPASGAEPAAGAPAQASGPASSSPSNAPPPTASTSPAAAAGPLPAIVFTGCSLSGSTMVVTWRYDGTPVPGQTARFTAAANGLALGGATTSTAGPSGGAYTTTVNVGTLAVGTYTVTGSSTAGGAIGGAANSVSAPAVALGLVTLWGDCTVSPA
jgi:RNA polymerase sigma factor (sigma-70 family)